jgi:Delta6-protoilludene synthase
MSISREVYLPDPLAQWPWPRTLNPHLADVKPDSDAWARGFEVFDSKSQRAFDLCNFGKPWAYLIFDEELTDGMLALLCGLGYPLLNKGLSVQGDTINEMIYDQPDCILIACNLMAFMFFCDESTDKVDSIGARAYAEMVMDALRNPHIERPHCESRLGEVARQYALSYPRALDYLIDGDSL